MHVHDLMDQFSAAAIEQCTRLNALELAEYAAFNRRDVKDHRTHAIDTVCRSKLPFYSTLNSIGELANKILTVKCAYCGGETVQAGGGGSGGNMSYYFNCKDCESRTTITFGEGTISCRPKEQPHRALSWVLKLKDLLDVAADMMIRTGNIEVNGRVTYDDSRQVRVGDKVKLTYTCRKGETPEVVEFECTEHDITGQPLAAGGTFTRA